MHFQVTFKSLLAPKMFKKRTSDRYPQRLLTHEPTHPPLIFTMCSYFNMISIDLLPGSTLLFVVVRYSMFYGDIKHKYIQVSCTYIHHEGTKRPFRGWVAIAGLTMSLEYQTDDDTYVQAKPELPNCFFRTI